MIEAGVVLDEDVEDNADDDFEDDDDDLMAMDPDDIKDEEALKRWLGLIEDDELNKRLEEAVQEENYEHAKMYQDEIRRRKNEKERNRINNKMYGRINRRIWN